MKPFSCYTIDYKIDKKIVIERKSMRTKSSRSEENTLRQGNIIKNDVQSLNALMCFLETADALVWCRYLLLNIEKPMLQETIAGRSKKGKKLEFHLYKYK